MRSEEDIRAALAERIAMLEPGPPETLEGRGIVVCAGGAKVFTNAYVLAFVLRRTLKSALPIEVWHYGEAEMTPAMRELLEALDVRTVDANAVLAEHPARIADGWQLKPYALMRSRFAEVLMLDSDQVPLADPAPLFDWPEYSEAGAVFWPDIMDIRAENPIWALVGLPVERRRSFETGQALIDKRRHWRALQLVLYLNEEAETFHGLLYGDKDTFLVAWALLGEAYHLIEDPPFRAEFGLVQRDRNGEALFQHRTAAKLVYGARPAPSPSFRLREECDAALTALEAQWAGRVFQRPPRSASARRLETMLAGALIRVAVPGGGEERVRLLANGDIGEGRSHDRQHWYAVEKQGGDCGEAEVALVFFNGARETAWLARDASGEWRGYSDTPPGLPLSAVVGELAPPAGEERRTLVDDLLRAAGFPDAEIDAALRAALSLLVRVGEDVPGRLLALAQDAALPAKSRQALEALAAEIAASEPPAKAVLTPVRPNLAVLRTLYVDSAQTEP